MSLDATAGAAREPDSAPPAPTTPSNPWVRRVTHGIAVLLSIAVLIALVRVARRDGPAALAAWRSAQVQWPWIAAAMAYGLGGHVIYALGWRRFAVDCGVALPVWLAIRMYLVSNLGRYLPAGKAWQLGIVGVMAKERGLPAGTLAATSLVQGIIGVAVGGLLLLVTGGAAMGVAPAWLVVPAAGLVGLLVAPLLLERLPRLRDAIVTRWHSVGSITVRTMWTLVWTSAVSWTAWGLGLHALAHGVLADPEASIGTYIAAWIGPFLAGLLSVVTPAGLGVRDAAMSMTLNTGGVTPANTVIVVVIARVWGTVLDAIPAGIALLVRRRGK
jgi:glycosyltransferase 2 family protein